MGPLLTLEVHEQMRAALDAGASALTCSLDLGRSGTEVAVTATGWSYAGGGFPWLQHCKDRTIYYWDDTAFQPASRFTTSLIKLVPTEWGAPTFEIDGIKMLPSAERSPYLDAEQKVKKLQPHGKSVLDCCGGLGYFADWCLQEGAAAIQSFEKNPDVIWLRHLNPWSPRPDPRLTLTEADVAVAIEDLAVESVDIVLHDPPRFAIAGELYSGQFYDQLARVLRPGGTLFHYTGSPNKLTSGRDVQGEVLRRLQDSGFEARRALDGVLARLVLKPVR